MPSRFNQLPETSCQKPVAKFLSFLITCLLFFVTFYLLPNPAFAAGPPNKGAQYQMPVLVLKYFPTTDGVNLDSSVTGVTATLADIRTKVDRITTETEAALQAGSTYHGYKDPSATQDLTYSIIDSKEYDTTLPLGIEVPWKPGSGIYRPDYGTILTNLNICNYVNNQGLREIWLYGWQYGNIEPAESVMSGPNGDISNSGGGNFNMPVCSKSYVLYNYNYGRDTPEAVHDHGHQIEIMLEHIDNTLMQDKFIGPWSTYSTNDGSGSNFHRCGWTHVPPNTGLEYDYANTRFSWTDCENWKYDGSGQKVNVNCSEWACDQTKFHTWRWQNMPGKNNPDPTLSNWWDIVGDIDTAIANHEQLYYPASASPSPSPGAGWTLTFTGGSGTTANFSISPAAGTGSVLIITDLSAPNNFVSIPSGATSISFPNAPNGTHHAVINYLSVNVSNIVDFTVNNGVVMTSTANPQPCSNPVVTDNLADNYITDENGDPQGSTGANIPEALKFTVSATGSIGSQPSISKTMNFTVDFSKLQALFGASNSNYLEGQYQNQDHALSNLLGMNSSQLQKQFSPTDKTVPKVATDALRKNYVNYVYNKPTIAESGTKYSDYNNQDPKTVYDLVTKYGLPNPPSFGGNSTTWVSTWGKYWEKLPTTYNEFSIGKLEFRPVNGIKAINDLKAGVPGSCFPLTAIRTVEFPVPNFFRTAQTSGTLNQVIVPKAVQSPQNGLIDMRYLVSGIASTTTGFIQNCFKFASNNPITNVFKKVVKISMDYLDRHFTANAASAEATNLQYTLSATCSADGTFSINFTWMPGSYPPYSPLSQWLDYSLSSDISAALNTIPPYAKGVNVTGQSSVTVNGFTPNVTWYWRVNTDWGPYLGSWHPSTTAQFTTPTCASVGTSSAGAISNSSCIKISKNGKAGNAPFCAIYPTKFDPAVVGQPNVLPGECKEDSTSIFKLNDQKNVNCTFTFTWKSADYANLTIPATGNGVWDSCTDPSVGSRTCTLTVYVWPDFRIPYLGQIWNNTLYSDTTEGLPTLQQTGRTGVYTFFTPKGSLEYDPIPEQLANCKTNPDLNSPDCQAISRYAEANFAGFDNCVMKLMVTIIDNKSAMLQCFIGLYAGYTKTLPGQTNTSVQGVNTNNVLGVTDSQTQKERLIGATDCGKHFVRDVVLKPKALQEALGIKTQCNMSASAEIPPGSNTTTSPAPTPSLPPPSNCASVSDGNPANGIETSRDELVCYISQVAAGKVEKITGQPLDQIMIRVMDAESSGGNQCAVGLDDEIGIFQYIAGTWKTVGWDGKPGEDSGSGTYDQYQGGRTVCWGLPGADPNLNTSDSLRSWPLNFGANIDGDAWNPYHQIDATATEMEVSGGCPWSTFRGFFPGVCP